MNRWVDDEQMNENGWMSGWLVSGQLDKRINKLADVVYRIQDPNVEKLEFQS